MEDQEMRTDRELLLSLVDTEPTVIDRITRQPVVITRKRVAHWTGRAVQTISDYCGGKYNIPIDFWRDILAHHDDPRIADLLLGRLDYELYIHGTARPETGRDFFRHAVEESGAHHEKQRYIAELLADGRIDELDASTVQKYCDAWVRQRMLDVRLHRSIVDSFNRAMAQKEPTHG